MVALLEDPDVIGVELQPDAPPGTLYLLPVDQLVMYGPGIT